MNRNKVLKTVGNIYFKALVQLLVLYYFKKNEETHEGPRQ